MERENPINKKEDYLKYISSPSWYYFRHVAFAHYGQVCILCGCNNHIHLHHLTYCRFKNEQVGDVIPLCEEHHKKVHEYCNKQHLNIYQGTFSYLKDYLKDKKEFKKICKLIGNKPQIIKKRKQTKGLGAYIDKYETIYKDCHRKNMVDFNRG